MSLETELNRLARQFEEDLINSLNQSGHNKTGKLQDSIQIRFTTEGNECKILISAKEYIKYLDDGNFLKDFIQEKKKELVKVIKTELKKEFIKQIHNK